MRRSLSSELLAEAGFAHAFFTRQGGVSAAPFDSLNFSFTTGDVAENVEENFRLGASTLGVPRSSIHFLDQVHGVVAVQLEHGAKPEETAKRTGDATFSLSPGLACGVRSADCGTVLVGDRRSGAACAIHAGWKGTVLGVVEAGIEALRRSLGGDGELIAAIGPHIEACCFEVGTDVAARLAACSQIGERAVVSREGEKAHVDLRAILTAKLEQLGLGNESIDQVLGCTVCDRERFFSYRRDGMVSGRMLSAIVVRR